MIGPRFWNGGLLRERDKLGSVELEQLIHMLNKIYLTYLKCSPPQIKRLSSKQKRENPSIEMLLSNITLSTVLETQLIRST